MKSIFRSRTFWVNVASAVAWLAALPVVAENPKLAAAAGVAASVVNIALRFVTKTSVTV